VTNQTTITTLLKDTRDAGQVPMKQLFELFYNELQKIAHARRSEWQGNITINTTALIHETYLKLMDTDVEGDLKSRKHFLAAASKAMRHILINYARDCNRLKRGGAMERVSLGNVDLPQDGEFEMTDERTTMLLHLGDALQKLDQVNPGLSQIIDCRIFAGMTIRETAIALDISPATVTRGWNTARLWLNREMTGKSGL